MKKITNYKSLGQILLVVSAFSALAGCGRDMSDLHRYIEQINVRPSAPIEPIPVIKPYMRFEYPEHERDPFDASFLRPPEEEAAVSSVNIDTTRAKEVLEVFPLDSLRMVGTVNQQGELWALIRVSDGTIHRVKKGNYIGINHGKIISVSERNIILSEVVDNGMGAYQERDNELVISNINKPQ